MAGYDIPEPNNTDPQVIQLAFEAKKLLEELMPPGSVIWLRDIKRDKYFRLLARVEINGVDIGAALTSKGFAVPYDGKTPQPSIPPSMAGDSNPVIEYTINEVPMQ